MSLQTAWLDLKRHNCLRMTTDSLFLHVWKAANKKELDNPKMDQVQQFSNESRYQRMWQVNAVSEPDLVCKPRASMDLTETALLAPSSGILLKLNIQYAITEKR